MSRPTVIVWFRDDLRVADNPALIAAVESGLPVVPIFIWSPQEEHPWEPGGASCWWLHQSLCSLDRSLRDVGSRLIIVDGASGEALVRLAENVQARSIFWNRRYEPAIIARDKKLKTSLRDSGIDARSFPGNLLYEPWSIQNSSGQPFRVFTPFWKALRAGEPPQDPFPKPKHIAIPSQWPESLEIAGLALEPRIDWAGGLRENWMPGEAGANRQLERFLQNRLHSYDEDRNRPDETGTSRLSPHLHFGEISPRQVWQSIQRQTSEGEKEAYLRQIMWREFAYHLLFHHPKTPREPLHPEFARFPWRFDRKAFRAWTKGLTGYPLVDAGMRQLWHTGWMHNRMRMVTASFLIKHLLIPWQRGAEWFWDTLVDADLANNTFGWQWTAGCGADATPYFRIFNPTLQGEKFDPNGEYVRKWIPEIARLPTRWIHEPWAAPSQILRDAGEELGGGYPFPIIDHVVARKRALEAFAAIRER